MPGSGMVSKWIDMRDLFCENPCVFYMYSLYSMNK